MWHNAPHPLPDCKIIRMSTKEITSVQEFETLPFVWTWQGVLRVSAVSALGLLLITMAALHDLLAAVLALILLVGFSLFLLRGKMFGFVFQMVARVLMWRLPEERLGALILGFLFADIGFYTVTSTATNVWNHAYGSATLFPASLATVSVIGFVAAWMCVLQPRTSIIPNHRTVNFVGGVLLVASVVFGVGLLGGTGAAQPLPPSDVRLAVENMAFSNTALRAHPGHVVVAMENHDLFWHTFTIETLGVDLKVPIQATQQIAFEAPAGVYTFHCTIPGHELLGMTGTLTVQ